MFPQSPLFPIKVDELPLNSLCQLMEISISPIPNLDGSPAGQLIGQKFQSLVSLCQMALRQMNAVCWY